MKARRTAAVVHDGHVGSDPGDGARDRQLDPEAADPIVTERDAGGQELDGHLRSRLAVVRDVQIARWPPGKPPRYLIPSLDRLTDPGLPLGGGAGKGSEVSRRGRRRLRALHIPILLGLAGPRGPYASTTAAVQMAELPAHLSLDSDD